MDNSISTPLSPPVYGLTHAPGLLDALPALDNNSNNGVRVINAEQFAAMHTQHILAHPPDGVLFPFLHGLEGDNHAQNTFFAPAPGGGKRRPPRFRGLVWVVADADADGELLEGTHNHAAATAGYPLDEEEEEEYSDEEDELEEELDLDEEMSGVEGAVVRIARGDEREDSGMLEDVATVPAEAEKHMHPVAHRAAAVPPTPSSTTASKDGDDSPITQDVPMQIVLPPPALPSSPPTSTSTPVSTSPEREPPTFLTCTFRPRELLRRVVTEIHNERPSLTHAPALRVDTSSAGLHHVAAVTNGNFNEKHQNDSADDNDDDEWEFRPARVPDGISLRNFGIQVPIYATLSDIVVYSPSGLASRALRVLARRLAAAVRRKRAERCANLGIDPNAEDAPLEYNVFVLDADARALKAAVPELVMRVFEGGERRASVTVPAADGEGMQVDGSHMEARAHAHVNVPIAVPLTSEAAEEPNTVDFGQRERDEMRELTRASEILSVLPSSGGSDGGAEDLSNTTTASHWRPTVGQVFLGNSGDVPLGTESSVAGGAEDPFDYTTTNSPAEGMGYDVCVECHEMAPFPAVAHLRAADEHLAMLDAMWDERVRAGVAQGVRPPPNANAVIHLPFPSAPTNTGQSMTALLPVVTFLERCLRPPTPPSPAAPTTSDDSHSGNAPSSSSSSARRWSTLPAAVSAASLFFPSPPAPSIPSSHPRTRSFTSPAQTPAPAPPPRTRPLKVLIYSSDGYTESSPLALTLLMAVRRLTLPEAYLELQVAKRRSFFVYPGELGLLRRLENRFKGSGEGAFAPRMIMPANSTGSLGHASGQGMQTQVGGGEPATYPGHGRPSAKSVSFAPGVAAPVVMAPQRGGGVGVGAVTRSGRPRARTSPWLPSFGDHQSWFNDPRFDGSFPSRVLPFLYLGNLNHASNAYMLHALGITHVVSVGECALVPPPGHCHCSAPGEACASCRPAHGANAHFIPGKGPGNQGSLWIEEREGRIKVLDIQGVCDDGIDTLEPQLEPICEWIEKARQEGGQVLVHCRVGVSRSATVTIAYVMKHLALPLVDAYLIVRSRRLSVLIQPNMRLLYNLCGWEIKLAKERANGDAQRMRKELARTLTWPYLAKEVHALNEKYLH